MLRRHLIASTLLLHTLVRTAVIIDGLIRKFLIKAEILFSLMLDRYNSLGQLFCVLCNAPVKSELLWNAHVQSKKHKEVRLATITPKGYFNAF